MRIWLYQSNRLLWRTVSALFRSADLINTVHSVHNEDPTKTHLQVVKTFKVRLNGPSWKQLVPYGPSTQTYRGTSPENISLCCCVRSDTFNNSINSFSAFPGLRLFDSCVQSKAKLSSFNKHDSTNLLLLPTHRHRAGPEQRPTPGPGSRSDPELLRSTSKRGQQIQTVFDPRHEKLWLYTPAGPEPSSVWGETSAALLPPLWGCTSVKSSTNDYEWLHPQLLNEEKLKFRKLLMLVHHNQQGPVSPNLLHGNWNTTYSYHVLTVCTRTLCGKNMASTVCAVIYYFSSVF